MIHSKLNLVCSAGHRHYSPTPEAFVGRGCSYTPFAETKKCDLPLRKMKTDGNS